MIEALALLTVIGSTPAQDGDWMKFVRSSEDGKYLLLSAGTPDAAMLEALPQNSDAPFKLLWSKEVVESWFGLGGATFSWKGDLVAVSDQGDFSGVPVTIYETATGKKRCTFAASVFNNASVRFTPDDRHVLVWSYSDYFKGDVKSGKVSYRGEFMPPKDRYEHHHDIFSAKTWPDPERLDVWHFTAPDGTSLAFDERQKRPVHVRPDEKFAMWFGTWRITFGEEASVSREDHGFVGGPELLKPLRDAIAQGLVFRVRAETVAVRPADRLALKTHSILTGDEKSIPARQTTVWSQHFELVSNRLAINPVSVEHRASVQLDFYDLFTATRALSLHIEFQAKGPPAIVAYSPDGFYAPISGEARAVALLPEGTTWVKDAQAVRSALAPLFTPRSE